MHATLCPRPYVHRCLSTTLSQPLGGFQLDSNKAIYRTLSDEPDGMVGLEVMRGAAGVAATLKQRAWQLEHAEDWTGALEVWEFMEGGGRL